MNSRMDKDNYYLQIAKSVAARSTCLKRQYGAVIVNKDEIIATGYNGGVRGGKNCIDLGHCPRFNVPHNSGDYSNCIGVHAEQNALISAARRDMINGDLYLFGIENNKDIIDVEPCPICRKMIINAGIKKVITLKGEKIYEG